jgi:hypothetical protein
MPGTWVTDMRHYLDEKGGLSEGLPRQVLNLAMHLGSIVGRVTSHPTGAHQQTNVSCRRSPGRRRCVGDILTGLESDGETIRWECPLCGDNGVIRDWMSTPWDRRARGTPALEIDLGGPTELVVLAVKDRAARCRPLHSQAVITLRATRLWTLVPGEIALVTPRKQWIYAGHPYLSGVIGPTRLDAKALDLTPLRLVGRGSWDPLEEYWGEDGDPIEEWARPIVARGPRPSFEMEQVLPGFDPDDADDDPIGRANDLSGAGDRAAAFAILTDLCQADLRCLDAHAHLGNRAFDRRPQEAIRHYEVGVRIGELSLGERFDGVLPWGHLDNRPFLRCLHGFGLCFWRLSRFDEAAQVFDRMLWLNPSDNQGVRLIIDAVRARMAWTPDVD